MGSLNSALCLPRDEALEESDVLRVSETLVVGNAVVSVSSSTCWATEKVQDDRRLSINPSETDESLERALRYGQHCSNSERTGGLTIPGPEVFPQYACNVSDEAQCALAHFSKPCKVFGIFGRFRGHGFLIWSRFDTIV